MQMDVLNKDYVIHSYECKETETDLQKIRERVCYNPSALDTINTGFEHTPLHDAVIMGHCKCVNLLLKLGADPNIMNSVGQTALHFSVYLTDSHVMEVLLSNGADPNISKHNRAELVLQACRIQAHDKLKLLLKYGGVTEDFSADTRVSISVSNPFEPLCCLRTPLTIATCEGDLLSMKLLLLYGAQTHVRNLPEPSLSKYWYMNKSLAYLIFLECMETTERKLQVFKMLHDFGVDILQIFRDEVATLASFKQMTNKWSRPNKDLINSIELIVTTPLSLQKLSRIAIRKSMPYRYYENMQQFESIIPNVLYKFLQYCDYD